VTVSTALDTHEIGAPPRLVIENSGIGIDLQYLPHLFERFYRGSHVAESSIPGAGLAWQLLKRLSLHQGGIEVERTASKDALYHVHPSRPVRNFLA